jgi:SAM-dependent methyltransferase
VDRLVAVLDEARERAGDENVQFVSHDLRESEFADATFDLVLMFGVIGLMSKEGDSSLLARVSRWLRPGGQLLIDNDKELAVNGTSGSIDHSDGQFRWTWTSDPETRLNHMIPEFETPDGTIYEMADPYEPKRSDHVGLIRYIYTKKELLTMLDNASFTTTEVPHYLSYVLPDLEDDAYALLCSSKRV